MTVCPAKPQILCLGHPCDLTRPNPPIENPQIIACGRPLMTLCTAYALPEANGPKAGAMRAGTGVYCGLSVAWMSIRGYGVKVLFSFFCFVLFFPLWNWFVYCNSIHKTQHRCSNQLYITLPGLDFCLKDIWRMAYFLFPFFFIM